MKIGIITINSENIGNRLQNYAVQKVLEGIGAEVYTLNNLYCGREVKTAKHILKLCIQNRVMPYVYHKRREKFYAFTDSYIHMDTKTITADEIPENFAEKYDQFICGSDQVWNPYFSFITGNEFLQFAKPEQRIAYAVSFGVSSMDKEKEDRLRRFISDFKAISVREESGAKLVRKIIGKDVAVLLDPTMMLAKEEWMKIACRPEYVPSKKYILTYFLGKQTDKTKKFIYTMAENEHFEVVNLLDVKVKKYFYIDPAEFIYLVANCSYVVTDSFHASVFSIIMGVPFSVQPRLDKAENMNSRIDSLFYKLYLAPKWLDQDADTTNYNLQTDYENAYIILEKEKERTRKYLTEAIYS